MIFDADTHMSPYNNFDGSLQIENWNELIEATGIDKALCWLLPQGVDDVAESNRYLYDCAKKYTRMFPFGWVNIREGLDKAKQDVRRCIEEYGFAGVKLNGAQNEYFIDSSEAMEIAGQIARLGGIIAYHIGADEPEYTDPARALKVAKAYPETPILMIHMGGSGVPDVSQEVIDAAEQAPNMILIGSNIAVGKVAHAIRQLGAERVMFGSDIPFCPINDCIREYRGMLKEFDPKVADAVFWDNAARVFNLG